MLRKKPYIVESSDISRSLLKRHFSIFPNLDVTAFRAAEPMLFSNNHSPNLIITDVNLGSSGFGKISGIELINKLRIIYPNVPYVVFTTPTSSFKRKKLLKGGAAAYVSKFDDDFIDHLENEVRNQLNIKSPIN